MIYKVSKHLMHFLLFMSDHVEGVKVSYIQSAIQFLEPVSKKLIAPHFKPIFYSIVNIHEIIIVKNNKKTCVCIIAKNTLNYYF